MNQGFIVQTTAGLTLAVALLSSASIHAQDLSRGQKLFENHCLACHKQKKGQTMQKDVKNLAELRHRIDGWAFHMGRDWGDSEVGDVLFYLNETVYHFKD